MSFSNAIIYRITIDPDRHSLAALEDALQGQRYVECTPTQEESSGWVPPRGLEHGALAESIGGHWILRLMTETRSVPGSVVSRKVDERVAQIEQTTGRKPGKKERAEIKENVKHELLPMAFSKQGATTVWIDPAAGLLVLDTSSMSRADAVVTALVTCMDGLAVSLVHTQHSPASSMAGWLNSQEAPSGFSIDREVELRATDESKAVVRYANHALDIDQVREHVAGGKMPTRLAMTWDDRVSFQLTEGLTLRKIKFLEGVFEGKGDKEDEFDGDVAIFTGELSGLIKDLVAALGGEQEAAALTSTPASTTAVASTQPEAGNDDLYDKAVAVVLEHRKASISLVQRYLQIGYNRAAGLLEAMEARQVVSPMAADGTRRLLKAA